MKKLSKMLLIPAALVAMAIPMTGANAAELAGEETVVLKATGMVTYSFEEEQRTGLMLLTPFISVRCRQIFLRK